MDGPPHDRCFKVSDRREGSFSLKRSSTAIGLWPTAPCIGLLLPPTLWSTPGARVPWAFSRVRRIAVLGPRPPKTGAVLLSLGFRQCYARAVRNAEKFAARGLYAIAQSLSGMWRLL